DATEFINGAYNEFSDTAFATNINKTGETPIVVGTDMFADNIAPSTSNGYYPTFRSADQSGTSQDPRLVVTHEASDPQLIGYWPLDEGQGSYTLDASGNGQ